MGFRRPKWSPPGADGMPPRTRPVAEGHRQLLRYSGVATIPRTRLAFPSCRAKARESPAASARSSLPPVLSASMSDPERAVSRLSRWAGTSMTTAGTPDSIARLTSGRTTQSVFPRPTNPVSTAATRPSSRQLRHMLSETCWRCPPSSSAIRTKSVIGRSFRAVGFGSSIWIVARKPRSHSRIRGGLGPAPVAVDG